MRYFSSASIAFMANSIALGTGNSPDSYLAIIGRLLPKRFANSVCVNPSRLRFRLNDSLSIVGQLYHGDTFLGKLIRLFRLRRFPEYEISGLLRCSCRMDYQFFVILQLVKP